MEDKVFSKKAQDYLFGTFSHLIDLMPDIQLFAKDAGGRIIFANQSYAEMCNVKSYKEIEGLTDWDLWPKNFAKKYHDDDRKIMETKKPTKDVVEIVPEKREVAIWHSTTKIPIFDSEGNSLGIAGFSRAINKKGLELSKSSSMTSIRDTILAEYRNKVDIKELASQSCLSISQFQRKFKAKYSLTPTNYIIKIRIEAACAALIQSDMPISKIASEFGFHDASHLYHIFKKGNGALS